MAQDTQPQITAKVWPVGDWFALYIETNLQSSLDNHAPHMESHDGHGASRFSVFMPRADDLEAMAQALLDGAAKIREASDAG